MDELIIKLKQRVPINNLNFDKILLPLNEDKQDIILNVLNEISKTNGYYSMIVLKKLIELFENDDQMEINELYYEKLMEWLQYKPLKPIDIDIITYTFNKNFEIKIKESPNLISGLGTTGMRTWEASLYLSNYLINNFDKFNENENDNNNILELGCGTGIVSICLIKKIIKDSKIKSNIKIYITDGDSQLVERIKDNIQLNNIKNEELENSKLKFDIRKLWWGEDSIPNNVKTILAADVTYDSSIIPDLIQVLNEGISEGTVKNAYIAATKRNEETLAVWEKWLDMGVSDGIWNWDIISKNRQDNDNKSDSLYYGSIPNEIFIYYIYKQ